MTAQLYSFDQMFQAYEKDQFVLVSVTPSHPITISLSGTNSLSLCDKLRLGLPSSHSSRLSFSLFLTPNTSNCLQPASGKCVCVCVTVCVSLLLIAFIEHYSPLSSRHTVLACDLSHALVSNFTCELISFDSPLWVLNMKNQ